MCGISGAVGSVDSSILNVVQRINSSLVHRGPDAEGLYSDRMGTSGGVILAHRRLSIIDLSDASNQPFLDKERGLSLVFNGEIYNYQELRKQLENAGHLFVTKSDTEVLLRSYVEWGAGCVNYFRGMFAFSLYDSRKNIVLIARDRMGIKPLYYSVQNNRGKPVFLFASEIRALMESSLIERKLNPASLEVYLWNGYVAGEDTIIRDIKKLNASSYLIISLDKFKIHEERYWKLPDVSDNKKEVPADLDSLRETLHDSVRKRMISDVPLGVFLSGGVDSSAIVSVASQYSNNLKTFNVSFLEKGFDESYYARRISDIYNTDHHEIRLTERDFIQGLPEALHSLDTPTFDGLNTYYLSKSIKDAGITVALSGMGGDELFGGYESFRIIPKLLYTSKALGFIPRSLLDLLGRASARIRYGAPDFIPHQARWAKTGDVIATRGDLLDLYQITYGLFRKNFISSLLLSEVGLSESQTHMGWSSSYRNKMEELVSSRNILHGLSQLELLNFVGERLIIDTDMTSMASALEVRVPLIDHELINALAVYDLNKRFYPIRKKELLKKIALEGVDASLFNRQKKGFEVPIGNWCHKNLKDEIELLFKDEDLCKSMGLNQKKVYHIWLAYQNGTPGLYWSRVWSLFVLLWWGRTYGVTL